MGSTTRAKPSHSLGRQALFFILVVSLAAGLLWAAWPRFLAALHYLPVDRAINSYYQTGNLPTGSLDALEQRANESLKLHDHPRYWDGLGLLNYLQAGDRTRPLYLQRESFQDAIVATRKSLQLAPVQPRAWLRLAHAESWLSFRDTGSIEAFKMSVYTGRVETALLISRMQLGFSRLGQLDEEARGLLRDQTLLAWRIRQKDISMAFRTGQLDFRRVSSLLALSDPGVVREMEEARGGRLR